MSPSLTALLQQAETYRRRVAEFRDTEAELLKVRDRMAGDAERARMDLVVDANRQTRDIFVRQLEHVEDQVARAFGPTTNGADGKGGPAIPSSE